MGGQRSKGNVQDCSVFKFCFGLEVSERGLNKRKGGIWIIILKRERI